MKTEADGVPLDEKLPTIDQSPTYTDSPFFELDIRFYIIYSSILVYIFVNSILSYKDQDFLIVIIVGLSMSVFVIVLGLFLIQLEQRSSFTKKTRIRLFTLIYLLTGLSIVMSDPQVLSFFSNKSKDLENSCKLLIFPYAYIGSRYMLKIKQIYYFLTYSVLILAFVFCWPKSQISTHILNYLFLGVYIYSLGSQIKELTEVQNFKSAEDISSLTIKNPNTPLEEIISEINEGISKILNISRETTPGIQHIHKKIIGLLKNILLKIQKSDNIYQPRLELVTKNMDEEDKIYIEQECFENLHLDFNTKIKRRQSEQNVIQPRMIEYGMSELSGFLRQIGKEWNFDSFFVTKCSKMPAFIIGKYAMKMYGLDELYKMDDEVLDLFLTEIENGYPKNPYHNSTHGADVMCSFLFFLTKSRLSESMTSIEWLCGIIASLGHDIGHPGKNNRFLVMTSNELAIQYNDISVLEMMHASTIFQIISKKNSNILLSLRPDKYVQCRKVIIDLVLATDMAKHFDLISYMRTKYNEDADFSNKDVRADIFKLCIKSSDVGHAAKNIELHEKWCYLVIEEFFVQGDEEKKRNLPISMYCDRENTNIAKSQAGFIRNIVLSLFTTLNSILVSEEIETFCINQLKHNEAYWESLIKQRNLSSIHKAHDIKTDKNLFPSLKRKTTRNGSLPPIYKSAGKF